MPTRQQTWRLLSIYDGFEHGGLHIEIDREASTPPNRVGRVVRVSGHVLDAQNHRVGEFTRLLAAGSDGLRARHEKLELVPGVRGGGFATALQAHAEAIYVEMGVAYITMHAEYVGSLLWPRLGFDFDLRHVEGATEQVRRAQAVLKLLSPRARKVVDLPRPAELLTQWAQSDDVQKRTAAHRMAARLPTAERLARDGLEGLLLDSRSLCEFDADRTGLGRTLMLGASWDGYKALAAP